MLLHSMGTNYRHGRDFRIYRPEGSGDNLLLIFRTPAFVTTAGETAIVPADTVMLYAKAAPQNYGAAGEVYINHWVHFECDENDPFFERLNIPFNRPVPLSSAPPAEELLELLRIESVSNTPKSRECTGLLLRLLIAQTLAKCDNGGENPGNVHSDGLKRLRAEIYGNPAGKYTVKELARRLSVSPSYFQALYRGEFGVSCYEDVLRAKTGLAQYYLVNTRMTVREISELCGFENDVHFMRQFRQRTGQTALEYRGSAASVS